jgi:NADPH-dependent glutamate synthase beta subunit-like oxidoreductase/NAD(P)H-flavin reductase
MSQAFNHKLLGFGINFSDLYELDGLEKIHNKFQDFLPNDLKEVYQKAFLEKWSGDVHDKLIISIAPYLEDFLSKLFPIENEVLDLQKSHTNFKTILNFKRQFVQRLALKKYSKEQASNFDIALITQKLFKILGSNFSEEKFTNTVDEWQKNEGLYKDSLDLAVKYSAWQSYFANNHQSILFNHPKKIDFENLLTDVLNDQNGVLNYHIDHTHCRNDFQLTDQGFDYKKALDQANYCIWCHHQKKDSCSKGLKDRVDPEIFQKNPLGVDLMGCPLEEKISQMNEVKSQGYNIGALAIIMIDNPLVAATGHRICNDCLKSCIYQKQDPVNIPAVESNILKTVLNLSWGFEIYSLLSRWNPLNLERPLPLKTSNYNVLVCGMGPSGFNLSHHLLNDGHNVVGMDGLKIEPLNMPLKPIVDIKEIYEDLDERITGGFGGVSEYGITVRWDKNFLKIIRLLLERRSNFNLFGGVKLGSNITIDQAFKLGFDHIALCTGAGSPTIIDMENNLSSGVKQASDFLMNLQLSGAYKKDSIANLQIDLPIVVIGGGLTAMDAATESLAYYQVQIKKFASRYQELVDKYGKAYVTKDWQDFEKKQAEEILSRYDELEKSSDPKALLRRWGGSTIIYRKPLKKSPAYTLNHEEVHKAFEEGINFIENAIPKKVILDNQEKAEGIVIEIDGKEKILKAKTIIVAAGTQPNINLNYDLDEKIPTTMVKGKKVFQALDEEGNHVSQDSYHKNNQPQVLIYKNHQNKFISFFGDLNPAFAGNVVKAMASAKKGYPIVTKVLKKSEPSSKTPIIEKLKEQLIATVHKINVLTPNIVEIIIKAPACANNFKAGQFYRMQNFETLAPKINNTKLLTETLALTGAWVDKQQGLISTIVLEMGGSSKILRYLKEGEPIVLMGPTGIPTFIPKDENVILVGGGLGNAVLFSIGKALKENNCKVLYFAGYKKNSDVYRMDDIQEACDQVVWCCDENLIKPRRDQDISFVGNVVEAMLNVFKNYPKNDLIFEPKLLSKMIVIGSDRMMNAVAQARKTILQTFLNPEHEAIGSINSPMQCMMKGICAQCLQVHIDPNTNEKKIVYSCIEQDQNLDLVDFNCLKNRLSQNSLQEKLTNTWVEYCLSRLA